MQASDNSRNITAVINRLRHVDWMAVGIYPLAVVLMESFWIYPVLVWISLWTFFAELKPALSLLSIIIVLAVSLMATRISIRQQWPLWLIQLVVIGCGIVTMLLALGFNYGGGHTILSGVVFQYRTDAECYLSDSVSGSTGDTGTDISLVAGDTAGAYDCLLREYLPFLCHRDAGTYHPDCNVADILG